MAVFTASVTVVLLIVCGLVVDLGMAWARRGELQVQADRAATFAAESLPARSQAQKLAVAKAVAYYYALPPRQRAG